MKKVGECISWKNVNGLTVSGEVIEVKFVVYKVKLPNGYIMSVSQKPQQQ